MIKKLNQWQVFSNLSHLEMEFVNHQSLNLIYFDLDEQKKNKSKQTFVQNP